MKYFIKSLLYILAYLAMTTILFLAVALVSHMHILLAIPIVVIIMFGFAWASVYLDIWF